MLVQPGRALEEDLAVADSDGGSSDAEGNALQPLEGEGEGDGEPGEWQRGARSQGQWY